MLSSSVLLKQTYANVPPTKKPTMQSVFSGNKLSSTNNNKTRKLLNKKMVKVHKKSRDELKAMKVVDLKAMVKRHNLHNQIKNYTTMKKAALVDNLMLFSRVVYNASSSASPPPKKRGRPSKATPAAPKKAQAAARTPQDKPKRGRPKKRIAPTLLSDETGKAPPMKSKGKGSSSFADAVSSIEAKASKMDKSKKGKKLVSNSPVKKSREPKTKNNYRTGRNFV